MNKLKTMCNSLLVLLTCVLFFSINVNAADNLYFDDPTTQVGEEITIRVYLSTTDSVSTSSGVLTYDPSMLEFVSGDSASLGEAGKIAIQSEEGVTAPEYNLTFKALKTGTTKIETESYTATGSTGELDPILGDSTITIEAGANGETEVAATTTTTEVPTGDLPTIDVDGVTYQIAQDFTEVEIPESFVASEMSYEGNNIKVALQESSGQYLIYLQSPEGEKSFFVYDSDNGKAEYLEQVYITNSYFIILLGNKDDVSLPSYYGETTLTLNGHEFPAWQNTETPEYYAVYALSSRGNKGMYTYDSTEETYQRMIPVKESAASDNDEKATGVLGKLSEFINEHFMLSFILICAIILLLLIILIVAVIKLRHRNIELDDLYDEYGIDADSESDNVQEEDASRKSNRQKYEEDDFESLEDDLEFDEEEFDDDDDDDSGVINLDDNDNQTIDISLTEDEDDDDVIIDDLDAFLDDEPKHSKQSKRPKEVKHNKVSDKFSDTDFIDLD
ncbi:MAG: cohesin domain-containing protein [Suipraeoptans sp.]